MNVKLIRIYMQTLFGNNGAVNTCRTCNSKDTGRTQHVCCYHYCCKFYCFLVINLKDFDLTKFMEKQNFMLNKRFMYGIR